MKRELILNGNPMEDIVGFARNRLKALLKQLLPIQSDGSIALSAQAWSVKGLA